MFDNRVILFYWFITLYLAMNWGAELRNKLDQLPMTADGARQAVVVLQTVEHELSQCTVAHERSNALDISELVDQFMTVYNAHLLFLPRPSYDGGVWFAELAKRDVHLAWGRFIESLLDAFNNGRVNAVRPSTLNT
jgi:hypothetical protein